MMPIYLFFDESGNLDFSRNGTKYYLFGVLTTNDPRPLNAALTSLRYELLQDGFPLLERFHASEDKQSVRNQVFKSITTVGGFDYDAIVIEKAKVLAQHTEPARFYPEYGGRLLSAVLARHESTARKIILITDSLPVKRQRQAVEKAFKVFMRRTLRERQFSVHHHSSIAHPGLQAADYCTWALYRKWHRGDLRSYTLIKPYVRSEVEAFGEVAAGG